MVRVPRCGVGGDKKRSPSASSMVDGVGCNPKQNNWWGVSSYTMKILTLKSQVG